MRTNSLTRQRYLNWAIFQRKVRSKLIVTPMTPRGPTGFPVRGSLYVVDLVVWSMKKGTPCSVNLISHPSGRGSSDTPWVRGSSHCVVLLTWLTKYILPLVGSARFSQPSGSGPRGSSPATKLFACNSSILIMFASRKSDSTEGKQTKGKGKRERWDAKYINGRSYGEQVHLRPINFYLRVKNWNGW